MKKIFNLGFILLLLYSCGNNQSKDKFEKIVSHYNKNICKTEYKDSVVYYEQAMKNGKYIMYNQAAGYILSHGYNCQIPIDNFSFIFLNFGKSNRKKEWLEYRKYIYQSNNKISSTTDIPVGFNTAINVLRRLEMWGMLNPDNFKNCICGDTIINTKSQNSALKVIFKDKDSHSLESVIVYKSDNYRIEEIYLNQYRFFSNIFWDFEKADIKLKYKYINDKCYVSSIDIYFKKDDIEQIISLNMPNEPSKVINLTQKEWGKLFLNDSNPILEYNSNKMNGLFSNKDTALIREHLETDSTTIEQQFLKNSQQIYYSETILKGDTLPSFEIKDPQEYYNIRDKVL